MNKDVFIPILYKLILKISCLRSLTTALVTALVAVIVYLTEGQFTGGWVFMAHSFGAAATMLETAESRLALEGGNLEQQLLTWHYPGNRKFAWK